MKALIKHLQTHTILMSGGMEAFFTPVNNILGVKSYWNRERAIINYCRQKWAHKHNLAPNVGSFLSYDRRGDTLWGYVTERLTTFKTELDKRFLRENPDYFHLRTGHPLVKGLKAIGFRTTSLYPNFDLHRENLGVTIKDEILPIDFGWGDPERIGLTAYTIDKTDIFDILKSHKLTIEEFLHEGHSFAAERQIHQFV